MKYLDLENEKSRKFEKQCRANVKITFVYYFSIEFYLESCFIQSK